MARTKQAARNSTCGKAPVESNSPLRLLESLHLPVQLVVLRSPIVISLVPSPSWNFRRYQRVLSFLINVFLSSVLFVKLLRISRLIFDSSLLLLVLFRNLLRLTFVSLLEDTNLCAIHAKCVTIREEGHCSRQDVWEANVFKCCSNAYLFIESGLCFIFLFFVSYVLIYFFFELK